MEIDCEVLFFLVLFSYFCFFYLSESIQADWTGCQTSNKSMQALLNIRKTIRNTPFGGLFRFFVLLINAP